MVLVRIELILLLTIASQFVIAQDKEPEFLAPKSLGNSINSAKDELLPIFSDLDETLYFARITSVKYDLKEYNQHDIWYSSFIQSSFSDAQEIPEINSVFNDAVIGIQGEDTLALYNQQDHLTPGFHSVAKKTDGRFEIINSESIKWLDNASNVYGLSMQEGGKLLVSAILVKSKERDYDLYLYKKTRAGWWAYPLYGINTKFKEISPFLATDSTLYFASDRTGGQGGMDIYYSHPKSKSLKQWTIPKPLNSINSDSFDAYFSISNKGRAFFVSNRNSSSLDIYSTEFQKREVNDNVDASVVLKTKSPKSKLTFIEEIQEKGQSTPEYIYFDLSSAEIPDSSTKYLDIIVDVLKSNEETEVELRGFADSTGSVSFNQLLSQKRSNAVEKYLKDQGIKQSRIKSIGYGESSSYGLSKNAEMAKSRIVRVILFKD